ncbi:MAG: hypothetical protein WAT79_14460 [Saprospiraceae bacterium]
MYSFKKLLLFLFFITLFFQCKKEDNYIFGGKFETAFYIPSGLSTVLTHYITVKNVYTDLGRQTTNAGLTLEDIKSIQASYGKMISISNTNDLDFIQNISVTLVSRSNPNLKKEMYYSDFVPYNVDSEIKLQSGAIELKEILKDDFIDIEIRLNIRDFVPNAIEAKLDMSYIVL